MGKILFNIPDDIKKELKETCETLGVNMTTVILSGVIKFIEEAKEKPKNK